MEFAQEIEHVSQKILLVCVSKHPLLESDRNSSERLFDYDQLMRMIGL